MKRTLLALAAVTLLTGAALAAGNFTGLPAATGPGSPSVGATGSGGPINPAGCIPMDTGFAQGINPATQCVSPSQLAASAGGVALSYATAAVGAVPLASLGNDTTPVAGTLYVAQLNLPAFTVTNIACLNGSAAATDRLINAIYDAKGNLVASTTTAGGGTVAAGVNAFQQIALTTPYVAVAGLYFIGETANGTTTRIRTITANGAGDLTASYAGSAGALPASIALPTAFANNVGPICYVN